MALSSATEHWIRQDALTITLNVLGPDIIQTSVLADTAIAAYKSGVIGYDTGHNFRTWPLMAYATALEYTGPNYVYAKLTRGESNAQALITYAKDARDIEGRITLEDGTEGEIDPDYFYIYLGKISASVDEEGNSVERYWLVPFRSGTLGTSQFQMEESEADWTKMFRLNKVSDVIEVLKNIASATIQKLTVATQFVFGGKNLTGVATSSDSVKINLPSDSDLTTSAYVAAHGKQNYLSKTEDDRAAGHIIFEKGLKSEGDVDVDGDITTSKNASVSGNAEITGNTTIHGTTTLGDMLTVGKYIEEGDIIQGARVTKEGVGSFAGLKSPYMQIYELIFNRKTAVQGEFAFSDGDTVEEVVSNSDGSYTLTLREQYDGYVTSFAPYDIIYANVNLIGQSGGRAMTGKCWMRVDEVEDDGLHLNVTLYSNSQVPSGVNVDPVPHMVITRHGNEVDESRQSVWVVSSEDGRMVQLTGVDSPIVNSETVYGTVVGILPDTLVEYIKSAGYNNIDPQQPYFYARGAVIQDLIQIDYKGRVIKTERYRGDWSLETAQSDDPYQNTDAGYDTVTHNGSKWACQSTGTALEPSEHVSEWLKVVSKGEDSAVSLYTIKPSVNVIYVRGKSLSAEVLDVTIGENNAGGYTELTEQSELDERGLVLQYAIDGEGERVTLVVGGEAVIEMEDGTGVIVSEDSTEEDEEAIYLEGESIDVSAIKDNITLYLVDESGNDIANQIIPVIKDGIDGREFFKSFVFLRANGETPERPVGGDYENPVPEGWSDGIPDGEEIVWLSSRIFSSDGNAPQEDEWTIPQQMTDTVDFDVEYSSLTAPSPPSGHPNTNPEWSNDAGSDTLWMATSRCKNGEWSDWQISKIKGESGKDGADGKDGVDGKDGADGKSYSLVATPSTFSFVVDAESGMTIASATIVTECTYYIDGVEESITSEGVYSVSTTNDENASISSYYLNGKIRVGLWYPRGVIPQITNIVVTANPPGKPVAIANIAVSYPQRGLVGPAGEEGPLLYPAGYYDEGFVYVQTVDSNGKATATPFVYYDPGNTGNGQYYVLQKSMAEAGILPTDTEYWKVFTKIKYIFTEAMMAQWARLAKAVFYGDYMFSAEGTSADGEKMDYSAYAEKMFTDGKLNGTILPNMFIDLQAGAIKVNKLSETFRKYRKTCWQYDNYGELAETAAESDIISYDTSYNIVSRGKSTELLLMPLMKDVTTPWYRACVFVRSSATPSLPVSGSYDSPIPEGWLEYVPEQSDEEDTTLWMATRIFTSSGENQDEDWTMIKFPVGDDSTAQIRYSSASRPSFDANSWGDIFSNAVWVAYRVYDGQWSDWTYANIRDRQVLTRASYEPDGVNSMVVVNPSIGYEKRIAMSLRNYPDTTNENANGAYGYTWNTMMSRALIVCADPRFFDKNAYREQQGYGNGVFKPNSEIEYYNSNIGDDFGYKNGNMSPEHFFVVDGIFCKFILLEPGSKLKMKLCTIDYKDAYVTGEEVAVHVWVVENSSDFAQIPAEFTITTKYRYDESSQEYIDEEVSYKRYGLVGEGNDTIDEENDYSYRGRVFGTKRMAQFYDLHKSKRGAASPATFVISLSDYINDSFVDDVYYVGNNTTD